MSLNVLLNQSVRIIEISNCHSGLGDGLQIRKKDTWLVGLCQEKEIMLFD